jgi:hypothetical protein
MPWPLSQDYNEAIQDMASSFGDADLKRGEAATNALGIPMPRSGNFADVYEVTTPKGKWAVKCFTRQIPGIRERYREISAYLKQSPLPFMVDFSYLEQGIRVRGDWYPVLKMQWVEGFNLNQFVKDNADKPALLDVLCQIWVKLAAKLTDAEIAHCDLQHGNVLLVPGSKAGSLAVKLVDYDGMCVPALTMLKTIEVGHPNFQHPQRARDGIYSLDVDRFSHLVIYTAVRALMAGGKALWEKYDNGDNLLFKARDFEAPQKSPLLAELLKSSDAGVRQLAETLRQSLAMPLANTPLLPEIAPTLPAPARTTAVRRTALPPPPVESNAFAGVGDGDASPRLKEPGAKSGGMLVGVLAAALVLGFGVLAAGGAGWYFLMRDRGKPDAVAQKPPDEAPERPVPKVEPPKKEVPKVVPPPKVEPPVNPDPVPKVDPPIPAEPVVAKPAEPVGVPLRLKDRDYVKLANSLGMLREEKFTAEAWVKLPNPAETKQGMYCIFGSTTWHVGVTPHRAAPVDRWSVVSLIGTSGSLTPTPTPWQADVWHHLACVRTAEGISAFFDGKLVGRIAKEFPPNKSDFFLGMIPYFTNPTNYEIRAFRASSTSRYNAAFTPPREFTKDDDTMVLLDFTGKDQAIKDLAGDHHGKIVGGAWAGAAIAATDPKPEPKPEPDPVTKPAGDGKSILRLKDRDRVDLANSAGLLDSDKLTVEAWLKLPTPADHKGRVHSLFGFPKWAVAATPIPREPVDRWRLDVMVPGGVSGYTMPQPWQPDTWHHLACVRNADELTAYVDGKPLTKVKANKALQRGPANLGLGFISEYGWPVVGDFRAFRASSSVRYTGAFSPPREFTKDDDTVVLLEFTGKGKTLKDLAGDHHGKITGGEWVETAVVATDPKPEPKPEPVADKPHAVQLQDDAYIELPNTAGMVDWNRPQTVELLLRLREPSQRAQCQLMGEYSGDAKNPNGAWHLALNCALGADQKPRWSFGLAYSMEGSGFSVGMPAKFPLTAETWHHVALVRNPPNFTLYVDGKLFWQGASDKPLKVGTTPLCIGGGVIRNVRSGFDGDIAGVRISKAALYEKDFVAKKQFTKDADTVLLLQFPGKGKILKDLAGDHDARLTNGKWLDEGPGAVVVNPVDPEPKPKPEPEPAPNKKRALQLSQDSYIEVANAGRLVDWNRPLSIELLLRVREPMPGRGGHLLSDYPGDGQVRNGSWALNLNPGPKSLPKPRWGFGFGYLTEDGIGTGAGVSGNLTLTAGTWHHVAMVRTPPDLSFYIDGQLCSKRTIDKPIKAGNALLCIGGRPIANMREAFNGEIAGLRISKARDPKDFDAKKEFTKDADTLLLLDFSGKGAILKDLAGTHRGRVTNAKWIEGADPVAEKPAEPEPKMEPDAKPAYLSDMPAYNLRVAGGRFGKKGNLDTQIDDPRATKIRVNGKPTPNGLSMPPDSDGIGTSKYLLSRRGGKFVASVALNDSIGDDKIPKPVTFVVLGDNKILWESNPVDTAKVVQECSVDVAGVQFLELRVMCTGANALAVWLEPRIVGGKLKPEMEPMPPPPVAGPANELPGVFGTVKSIAVSADGKRALVTNQQKMTLWDLTTRQRIRDFAHEGWVNSVALSSDGKRAFSGSGNHAVVPPGQPSKQVDCNVRVWDLESGEELQRLEGHKDFVTGLAISADGTRLVSSATRDLVRLWDLTSKKAHRQLPISDARSGSAKVALSADGKIVLAAESNTVCAAQLPTGKSLWRQAGHTNLIHALAMTADGRLAASGGGSLKSENGELTAVGTAILLWDVKTGRPLGQFSGHNAPVYALALSKDGKYLVSGAGMTVGRNGRTEHIDCTVRVWDVKTRKEVRRFEGHTTTVYSVAFYGEGRNIISGDGFGKIRLWDMDAEAPEKP